MVNPRAPPPTRGGCRRAAVGRARSRARGVGPRRRRPWRRRGRRRCSVSSSSPLAWSPGVLVLLSPRACLLVATVAPVVVVAALAAASVVVARRIGPLVAPALHSSQQPFHPAAPAARPPLPPPPPMHAIISAPRPCHDQGRARAGLLVRQTRRPRRAAAQNPARTMRPGRWSAHLSPCAAPLRHPPLPRPPPMVAISVPISCA